MRLPNHISAITMTLSCYEVEEVAAGILHDPQAHIDALVEAGVLEKTPFRRHVDGSPTYSVVQPHKHEWRVDTVQLNSDRSNLVLVCIAHPPYPNCPERLTVPNRLPIEMPE